MRRNAWLIDDEYLLIRIWGKCFKFQFILCFISFAAKETKKRENHYIFALRTILSWTWYYFSLNINDVDSQYSNTVFLYRYSIDVQHNPFLWFFFLPLPLSTNVCAPSKYPKNKKICLLKESIDSHLSTNVTAYILRRSHRYLYLSRRRRDTYTRTQAEKDVVEVRSMTNNKFFAQIFHEHTQYTYTPFNGFCRNNAKLLNTLR